LLSSCRSRPTKIRLQFALNTGGIHDDLAMGFGVDDVILYAQTPNQEPPPVRRRFD
jgi:hypothetical protein